MATQDDLEAAIGAGIARGGAERDLPEPYLVYADWLQERGDPRGDLIAVQHAREVADSPELRGEEQSLLGAHLATWLGPAHEHVDAGQLELVWRRGYVWAARIRKLHAGLADDPVAILRAFAPLPVARFVWHLAIEVASFGLAWRDIADDVIAALPATVANVDLGRSGNTPAHLEIVAIPATGEVRGHRVGSRVELHPPDVPFQIGRIHDSDLVCYAPGQGGRRNSSITHRGGRWFLQHMGHVQPITVNGHSIHEAILCDGDRIEPAPGLTFRFAISGTTR